MTGADMEARVAALENVVDGLLVVVNDQAKRLRDLGVVADVIRHARPPDRGRRRRAV